MTGRSAARTVLAILLLAAPATAGIASAGQPPAGAADLEVVLTGRVDPVVAGHVQLYGLRVTNHGPSPATGVTLQQDLPSGGVLLGVEPTSIGCQSITGLLLECALPRMRAGESVDLTIGVLVDSRVDGVTIAGAAVAGDQLDPVSSNDQTDVETRVTPARRILATRRGGAGALAISVKEGETSVGLAFTSPTGDDRAYSVEAPGFRATSLVGIPSFGASASPELVVLAAGFEGEARLLVIDAADRSLLAAHDLAGDWLPIDVVPLASFAATPAAELAVLLRDRSGGELRIRVVDAASGAGVSDFALASAGHAAERGWIGAPVPVGMVAAGDVGGTGSSELAILSKSAETGEVELRLVDVAAGETVAEHSLGAGLFPLGLVAIDDLGLEGGTAAADLAALVRAVDGDLFALVLDATNGVHFEPIDFEDAMQPGAFEAVPGLGGGKPALAVAGRIGSRRLGISIRSAATGTAIGSLRIPVPSAAPVALDLTLLERDDADRGPGLAILYESYGGAARVRVVRPEVAGPLIDFALP